MSGSVHVSLPPLQAVSFLPFILAQAVLLHPAVPAGPSRVARFLLLFPAVYLAFISPFRHRIEPTSWAIGANFRWGIFGPNFIMKALEWGLAVDRTPYLWIGHDSIAKHEQPTERTLTEANGGQAEANGLRFRGPTSSPASPASHIPSPPPTPPRPDKAPLLESDIGSTGPEKATKDAAEQREIVGDGLKQIVLDGVHLMSSMRGVGYAFGPPTKALGPPTPRDPLAFLTRALRRLAFFHLFAVFALIVIINRTSGLPKVLGALLPSSFPIQTLSNLLAYFFVGANLYAQLNLGHEAFSIVFLCGTIALRAVLPRGWRPRKFDSRDWPPMFNNPTHVTSVTFFWSSQWHSLFRKPFTSVGFDPVFSFFSPLVGKSPSRLLGALAVFILSGWMHDQALFSARYDLTPPFPTDHLSFTERYGGWIFFLAQAVAVGLEGLTKGRLRGRAWAAFWLVAVGLLAGRCWIALGLVDSVPPVDQWSWERFVIPSAAMAPPPLFVKHWAYRISDGASFPA